MDSKVRQSLLNIITARVKAGIFQFSAKEFDDLLNGMATHYLDSLVAEGLLRKNGDAYLTKGTWVMPIVAYECYDNNGYEGCGNAETVYELVRGMAALTDRFEKLNLALEAITSEFESTVHHMDAPAGGQKVPFHGDFASAARVPSVASSIRWWANHLRSVLNIASSNSDTNIPKHDEPNEQS